MIFTKKAPEYRVRLPFDDLVQVDADKIFFGERGATVNVGRRGTTVTTGLPGTGLSYRERVGKIRPVHRHSLLSFLLGLGLLWLIFGHH